MASACLHEADHRRMKNMLRCAGPRKPGLVVEPGNQGTDEHNGSDSSQEGSSERQRSDNIRVEH